jgi:hypothetical protein
VQVSTRPSVIKGKAEDYRVIKDPHQSRDPPTTASVTIDARPEWRHVTCGPNGAHDEIEVRVDAKLLM